MLVSAWLQVLIETRAPDRAGLQAQRRHLTESAGNNPVWLLTQNLECRHSLAQANWDYCPRDGTKGLSKAMDLSSSSLSARPPSRSSLHRCKGIRNSHLISQKRRRNWNPSKIPRARQLRPPILSQSNKSLGFFFLKKEKSKFQVITLYELYASKLISLKYMHVLRESRRVCTHLWIYTTELIKLQSLKQAHLFS